MTPQTFDLPPTFDAMVTWLDQLVVRSMQALEASLLDAVEVGEIDADTNIDEIIEASMLASLEGREDVLRQIQIVLKDARAERGGR